MYTIEVNNTKSRKQFLNFPVKLYADDKNWIQPLNQDIEKVFDPEKNKLFKRGGKAIRWILFDGNDQIIGRIAAFVNPNTKVKKLLVALVFLSVSMTKLLPIICLIKQKSGCKIKEWKPWTVR